MAHVPNRDASYGFAKETELDEALKYLAEHKEHKRTTVDRQMLRTVFNAVTKKRERGSKLALLSATVIRDHVPARDKGNVRIIEAYTSGVMKMFSVRSVNARKRNSAPSTVSPATVHPEGKYGQLILL